MFEAIRYEELAKIYKNEKPFKGYNKKHYDMDTYPITPNKRKPDRHFYYEDGKFYVCNSYMYEWLGEPISQDDYNALPITKQNHYGCIGRNEYQVLKVKPDVLVIIDENNHCEFVKDNYPQSDRYVMTSVYNPYGYADVPLEENGVLTYCEVVNDERKGGTIAKLEEVCRKSHEDGHRYVDFKTVRELLFRKGIKIDLNTNEYVNPPKGIKKVINRKLLADKMKEYESQIKLAKAMITSLDEQSLMDMAKEVDELRVEKKFGYRTAEVSDYYIEQGDITMAMIAFAIVTNQMSSWGVYRLKFDRLELKFRQYIAEKFNLYNTKEIDYANMTKLTSSARKIELSIA